VVFLVHVALASVLWQEVDEETLSLSEHPDIDIRGKVSVVMRGYCVVRMLDSEMHTLWCIYTHDTVLSPVSQSEY